MDPKKNGAREFLEFAEGGYALLDRVQQRDGSTRTVLRTAGLLTAGDLKQLAAALLDRSWPD